MAESSDYDTFNRTNYKIDGIIALIALLSLKN
jgi:hypothetical protein